MRFVHEVVSVGSYNIILFVRFQQNAFMSDYINLITRILYWAGVLLIVRFLWITYLLLKLFPVVALLLASVIGWVFLFE